MKQDKLAQMSQVTEAVYLAEFRKVHALLQEEARLRGALAQLKEQADSERKALSMDMPMQTIGADLLWQAWLVRSQRQLNIELSQVLAKKATVMEGVRHAFGRRNAVQSMSDQFTADRVTTRRKAQLERLLQINGGV
ncbi:hypothetical protein [Sedimentitalea todarodis]|uniref:Flagellar export protein FliJ n=1 Tax=Sedimentitalea todarodis TaxID=1631240 RepID=A0ABU3VLN9_9RHOB|nr:hypothetical protein [Sedimentitalea todarodis]MDU9006584.1 hypothetical protein [Sedimentitalea todarodis]